MDIDKIKKVLKIFIAVIVMVLLVSVLNKDLFTSESDEDIKVQKAFDSDAKNSLSEDDDALIYVHITGEIKKPGVYKMKADTRMDDLVKEAGGLTNEADIDQINLSEKLVDEERIIVPSKSEESEEGKNNFAGSTMPKQKKININTADLTELKSLPGVGDKTAQKIIDYRGQKKFKKIEDIMNIEGIGENKFKNIKDFISVNGRWYYGWEHECKINKFCKNFWLSSES